METPKITVNYDVTSSAMPDGGRLRYAEPEKMKLLEEKVVSRAGSDLRQLLQKI